MIPKDDTLIPKWFRIPNLVLNAAVQTAKIRSLVLQSPKGPLKIRPDANVLILAPPGSGKSHILRQIFESHKLAQEPIARITGPGLVGTITSEGFTKVPYAWDCRRSVLLCDEFSVLGDQAAVRPWNSLLDSAQPYAFWKYSGGFARKKTTQKFPLVDTDDGKPRFGSPDPTIRVDASGGTLTMTTRFVPIIATYRISAYHWNDDDRKALRSRCIELQWQLTAKESKALGWDLSLFEPIEFNPQRDIVIPQEEWRKILDKAPDIRTAHNIARIYAVVGEHGDYEKFIADRQPVM